MGKNKNHHTNRGVKAPGVNPQGLIFIDRILF
jgi:hypothetical protein